MPWTPLYDGFAVKVRRTSAETGWYTMLFRGEASRVEPRHRHLGAAEVYVVSGAVEYRPGRVAGTGSWMYEPAGALHTATRYVEDTVGFAVAYGPVALLDDTDTAQARFDWRDAAAIMHGDTPPGLADMVDRDE